MAIRDRVRRALHKSDDSSSSYSQSGSNITTTTIATTSTSQTSSSSTNSSLRHHTSKLFSSWRSRDRDDGDREKDKKKKKSKPIHPRDRPLTQTNLRHQEMLSHFTMTFGSSANRLSQVIPADFDLDGISPCCTRAPSINGDFSVGPDDLTTTTARTSMDEPPTKLI